MPKDREGQSNWSHGSTPRSLLPRVRCCMWKEGREGRGSGIGRRRGGERQGTEPSSWPGTQRQLPKAELLQKAQLSVHPGSTSSGWSLDTGRGSSFSVILSLCCAHEPFPLVFLLISSPLRPSLSHCFHHCPITCPHGMHLITLPSLSPDTSRLLHTPTRPVTPTRHPLSISTSLSFAVPYAQPMCPSITLPHAHVNTRPCRQFHVPTFSLSTF